MLAAWKIDFIGLVSTHRFGLPGADGSPSAAEFGWRPPEKGGIRLRCQDAAAHRQANGESSPIKCDIREKPFGVVTGRFTNLVNDRLAEARQQAG